MSTDVDIVIAHGVDVNIVIVIVFTHGVDVYSYSSR